MSERPRERAEDPGPPRTDGARSDAGEAPEPSYRPEPPAALRPRDPGELLVWLAVPLYAALSLAALAWLGLAGRPLRLEGRPGAIAAGLGLGLAVVLLSRWLTRTSSALRGLARGFRELLGTLGPGRIALLAVCSGIGEELLFRGAMQPAWGLVPTSLAFGLLHVGPDRRYLPWTVFAVVMGFLLGGLQQWTGDLAAPIVAHVAINALNLHALQNDELLGLRPG